jgi:hypothetical protein
MSRNYVLAAGAVLWTVVGLIAFVYLLNGNVLIPALMAAVGIPWLAWLGLTRRPLIVQSETGPADVDATS